MIRVKNPRPCFSGYSLSKRLRSTGTVQVTYFVIASFLGVVNDASVVETIGQTALERTIPRMSMLNTWQDGTMPGWSVPGHGSHVAPQSSEYWTLQSSLEGMSVMVMSVASPVPVLAILIV